MDPMDASVDQGRSTVIDAVGPFDFCGRPRGSQRFLGVEPRLESWDAKTARSQVELSRYLDHVRSLVDPDMATGSGSMGVELMVGVAESRSLISGGGDVDNYLYPVVRALGAARFNTAWVTKHRGPSTITVGPVHPATVNADAWSVVDVLATTPAQSRAFKEQIFAAAPNALAPAGAVEMQIGYRLSSRRNWAALWKPTIDALGPILGMANPLRPFMPDDDRITSLGLHRTIDETIGWNIAVRVCWRATA